jgi:hypothetical protein
LAVRQGLDLGLVFVQLSAEHEVAGVVFVTGRPSVSLSVEYFCC